jgi:LacI family transcriptional regulator
LATSRSNSTPPPRRSPGRHDSVPPGPRRNRPTVALLIESSNAYARGLLAGITDYIRQHATWSISLPEQGRGDAPPPWLNRWRGDGMIARIETPTIARAVMATGVPVVDVSAARAVPSLPWVETDDTAIARLAFEHLANRGYRELAFCGDSRFNWSRWRQDEFDRLARQAGRSLSLFDAARKHRGDASEREARLRAWVQSLPRPVGIFCCYDILAHQVLDSCRDVGRNVPEEAAVVGVDNDEVLCNLCTPSLTSIVPDPRQAGFEAAKLLAALMAGRPATSESILVPPLGVAARQSSAALAVDDPDVAAAWRFIREHAADGIQVSDVVRAVGLTRRVLDQRFQSATGRTPHAEITRLRIERMQQLLTETELSLADVALRTGFEHVEYASVFFRREVGVAPGEFRRQAQLSRLSEST